MTSFLSNNRAHAREIYKPQECSDLGGSVGSISHGVEGGWGGAEDARLLSGVDFGISGVHQAVEVLAG